MDNKTDAPKWIDNDFDFDDWAKLAENNPQEFEKQRQLMISRLIESAPGRLHQRLECLQWRVDMEIRRSKSSLDACARIYTMMMDSLDSLKELIESLNDQLSEMEQGNTNIPPSGPRRQAMIIPFPVPADSHDKA